MTGVFLALLKGVPVALAVTGLAFLIGAVLGIPLVLMRRARSWLPRLIARIYIDVMRGIPPVVWLFIIFFGLGSGIVALSPFRAAVLGMGLISAAYLAEIYRGGFLTLPAGQNAAAVALGLTRLDTLRYVLAPQVLRVSVAPMATFLVSLLKDTTVASTIGVRDVMMLVTQQAQAAGGGFAPFIAAAVLYILLSIPVAVLARTMDARMRGRIAA
ncbi:MAG TPA: amino acid ABC transporter permease [Paracoccus solventivorans]|uniref:Amino acid ABC transporter permease n=1 Tax=Paracoccus solventivorans TaxID=53463 RepID=A0A832QX36_9RHOB|nr:amino acid ABC transporter permease [Paracoccus solventivorans]HHW32928.1 amino acid ABC transporter permease [Paracoccus solventivorans]HMM09846.1 amino acid ABC transporter permease [Paracoccus solventivorans]